MMFLLFAFFTVACSNESALPSAASTASSKIGSIAANSPREVTTESVQTRERQYTIVIDPGHGGKDPGSTGVSGQFEKAFTLSLSQKLAALLKTDTRFLVFMTRDDDSFLSSESLFRPQFANDLDADMFISIHGNTFESPDASGTESFYYHDESMPFAEIIHKHAAEATGFTDRGYKQEGYYVIRETEMPSVLIEIGYMTNPDNEREMWKDDFQNRVAQAIVNGINEYVESSIPLKDSNVY